MARVLIVDDQEESRYFLEVLLKSKGYEVAPAANGAEALEKLKSGKFDLIISDILMPEIDGFELCRRIRRSKSWKSIPFIVYTATYTGPEDEAFALKIGADRFIKKPCEPDVLFSAIEEVIQSAVRREITSWPSEEKEAYKVYSERLVRKLEQKANELEQEIQARREAENNFRSVLENANDGIIISGPDGKHLYANKRASEITGYSIEELLTIGMKGLGHPEEIPKLSEILKKRIAGEKAPSHYETKIVRKDGKIVPIEVSGASCLWQGKEASVIIIRDITEKIKNLEQLRESEAKYKALVESSIQGLLVVQDFRIVYANERCTEITGYSIDELLSMSTERVISLVHPDDQQLVWGRFKERIAGEEIPARYEYRVVRKNGEVRWVEMYASLIEYGGKPAVQAAIVDITALKKAEEELRKSEEKYRLIAENVADVITVMDMNL